MSAAAVLLVAGYPLLQVRAKATARRATADGCLCCLCCRLTCAMKRAAGEGDPKPRKRRGGWDEGAAAPFTPLTGCGLPEFPTPGNRRPWEQVPKMHRDPLALEPGSRSPAGRLTPRIICRALSARHPLRGQHAERDGHRAHAHRALHKGREKRQRLCPRSRPACPERADVRRWDVYVAARSLGSRRA